MLLVALCQFTIKQLDEFALEQLSADKISVDKTQLYDIAARIFETKLSKNKDAWVRNTWKSLNKIHADIYQGYVDYLEDSNKAHLQKHVPCPQEEYTPGQGERKYYWLWPMDKSRGRERHTPSSVVSPDGMIVYRRETVKKANLLYRWFIKNPTHTYTFFIKFYVLLFVAPTLIVLSLVAMMLFYGYGFIMDLSLDTPLGIGDIFDTAIIMATYIFLIVVTIQHAIVHYQVFRKRAVIASFLINITSDDFYDSLLICGNDEDAPEATVDDPIRRLQLVRYKSQCPVCNSVVGVIKGRGDLKGRLIGSCWQSPDEHVFSFDPVTRKGFPLRQTLQHLKQPITQ